MKKKKAESLPRLKLKAWTIFSRIVRKMHSGHDGRCQCVSCGRWDFYQNMHAGHFVPKNKGGKLWFECRNVHPQCPYCNTYLHGNLIPYTQYMIRMYGEEEVTRLQSLAGPHKVTRSEYHDLIAHLKECELEL